MKDDFMQKFGGQPPKENQPEKEDGNLFDTVPEFTGRQKDAQQAGEPAPKKSMEESRKEKVKNFSIHFDDAQEPSLNSTGGFAGEPENKPEEEKDIYSFSSAAGEQQQRNRAARNPADAAAPKRRPPLDSVNRREREIDISGGKKAQAPAAPAQEEEEAAAAGTKWPGKKKKHKKGGGCLKGVFLATIITVCSVILSWYIISCVNDLLGLVKTEDMVVVSIPEGATTDDVAQILKEKGLVDQELFFKIFTGYKYRNEKKYPGYIAGEYELNGKMGYEGMVNKIKYPVETNRTVMLTFPEGMSLIDIAKKLEENNVCKVDDFVKAVNDETYDYTLVDAIPKDERFYKLEGYVFPDTYEFYINENPKSVVNRFVKTAQTRIGNDLLGRANELGMTMDQVLTLASIIQKEASDPNEMGKVSSVFHNRLNKSETYPNLQSDPTINYVENDIVPYLSDPSQKEKYAQLYNTYKCVGLPVSPICSPGLAAIRAALYPEKTGYYFFVTDKNNKYYYARTNSEHEANIAAADRVNKKIEEAAEQAIAAN